MKWNLHSCRRLAIIESSTTCVSCYVGAVSWKTAASLSLRLCWVFASCNQDASLWTGRMVHRGWPVKSRASLSATQRSLFRIIGLSSGVSANSGTGVRTTNTFVVFNARESPFDSALSNPFKTTASTKANLFFFFLNLFMSEIKRKFFVSWPSIWLQEKTPGKGKKVNPWSFSIRLIKQQLNGFSNRSSRKKNEEPGSAQCRNVATLFFFFFFLSRFNFWVAEMRENCGNWLRQQECSKDDFFLEEDVFLLSGWITTRIMSKEADVLQAKTGDRCIRVTPLGHVPETPHSPETERGPRPLRLPVHN